MADTFALVITMHDEAENVTKSIINARENIDACFVVQSGNTKFDKIVKTLADSNFLLGGTYELFPDLSGDYSKWESAAQNLCRNYALLFSIARGIEVDYVVAMTGDTLLENFEGIRFIVEEMKDKVVALGCMRAIGQEFHSADLTLEDMESGKGGGRIQGMVCDFQAQLFVVEGAFIRDLSAFTEIDITNRWCPEQCLGDAFMKAVEQIKTDSHLLLAYRAMNLQYLFAKTAYDFDKGVKFNVR
ncbi:MAG: hypothetical protein KKD77_22950 [Gammaproteobacteria bacterium]|nr:hypothetical protein [Gammaproteobacteria bacterium]